MSVLLIKENGDNLENSFKKIFDKFNFYPKNSVFIKPNLSGRAPIKKSENTDADFLEKLIKVLQKRGCKKIIIGHSSLLGTADRFQKNNGFSLVDFVLLNHFLVIV